MLPKKRTPTHPGEILQKEFLEPMGLTQTALAKHLGWSHAKINEIVSEKRGVSPEAALSLADVFGTSAEMWVNLQSNYDLWHAQQGHKKKTRLSKVS
jgi:addiction module HigA family antidote